ncbi:MAG: hypothetical protein KGZ65_06240 [Sphingomonadales bacterium]|nr:hypothetical protein [Sphingomonadaceae bacterium]MBS3930819.1 hypothetical protein [Sphingomonadales bacterium]
MNPKQQRAQEAQGDPIGDLRERMAKVETICKYGFPALGLYITALRFVPSSVAQLPSDPVKPVSAVLKFLF